jgi:acyl-CoA thioesterase FadM
MRPAKGLSAAITFRLVALMTPSTEISTASSEALSSKDLPASIVVQRRIEWPDTDASGRWHNTAAFRFVEVAETALLERLGILDDVYGRLPRVRIEADFVRLLEFRDLVDCSISVMSVGTSSITYDFAITKGSDVCASAKVVAVLLDDKGKPARWPDGYRTLLLSSGPQAAELIERAEDAQ